MTLARLILPFVLALGVWAGLATAAHARLADPADRLLPDTNVFVLRDGSGPVAAVLARYRITPQYRYESRAISAFAARLTRSQWRRLVRDPAVSDVCPGRWGWIVQYDYGVVDTDKRTNQLELKYGFRTRHRYQFPPGFAATLSPRQLRGLSREPDVELIEPDRLASYSGS